MPEFWIILIWAVLLVMAWPYVQKIRHPNARPLAAYLIFASILIVMTSTICYAGLWLIAWASTAGSLDNGSFASSLLAVMSLIGLILAAMTAGHVIRRPPRPGRPPP